MIRTISNAGQIEFSDLERGKSYTLTMVPEVPADVDIHFNIGNNGEFFPWNGADGFGFTSHEVTFVAFSDKIRVMMDTDPSEELSFSVIQS